MTKYNIWVDDFKVGDTEFYNSCKAERLEFRKKFANERGININYVGLSKVKEKGYLVTTDMKTGMTQRYRIK